MELKIEKPCNLSTKLIEALEKRLIMSCDFRLFCDNKNYKSTENMLHILQLSNCSIEMKQYKNKIYHIRRQYLYKRVILTLRVYDVKYILFIT